MTLYLQMLVLNFLLIMGLWKVFQKDEVFGFIGDFVNGLLGQHWSKPFVDCPPCMSSVWGTAFFFGSGMYHWIPWFLLPFHVLALCGLGTIVTMLDHHE